MNWGKRFKDYNWDIIKFQSECIDELNKFKNSMISAMESIGWGITLEDAAKRGYDADTLRFMAHLEGLKSKKNKEEKK